MTNPDKDIYTHRAHGTRMDVKKANDRAKNSWRFFQYWRRRNANQCVDCGSSDFRTLNGLCRCAYCQQKHTDQKAAYRARTGRR